MTDGTFDLPGAVKILHRQTPQGALHLHVFHPVGHVANDPRPAVVFFFGGGWKGGTPEQFAPLCSHLASRGLVAVSAEYRVSSRHGTTPRECVADGKAAVRYLRAHADEIGIDPSRLAVGGGSAGGHVAAATHFLSEMEEDDADTSVSCFADALILFNPVIDTSVEGWAGAKVLGDERDAFSPLHHVTPNAPPALVFHGEADDTVSVENAIHFAERMREVGSRCDLHTYEGAGARLLQREPKQWLLRNHPRRTRRVPAVARVD